MKIRALQASGFGALGELRLEFNGASTVILGSNESGKTALVDAVSCALYGAPRANTVAGRMFAARYGDKFSASASLLRNDGTAFSVSEDDRLQDETHPYELFRSLLTIREGECRLPERDKDFLDSFSAKVLGAGSVDIREAMRAVKRVYSPDERHRWSHLRSELLAATESSSSALLEAAEMERSAAKKSELSAQLAALDARAAELQVLRRQLELTGDRLSLERLKTAQAQLAHQIALECKR
ncbi:MAG TPA: AAA family ATPase, partial [Elusimicrobiales bacterium]|nr:AAA family ATPase [Elusimicrobiales bacterium]